MPKSTLIPTLDGLQLLLTPHERQLVECQHLREQVFARELGWVSCSPEGREQDDYDAGSLHVAVRHQLKIVGYLRITPADCRWMLEDCFPFLLTADKYPNRPRLAVEVSRLAVHPSYRGQIDHQGFSVLDWLIRGLVAHTQALNCQHWYVVLALPVFHLLCAKGMSCQPLGEAKRMPDGVVTIAARIDMLQFLARAPLFFGQEHRCSPPRYQTAITP